MFYLSNLFFAFSELAVKLEFSNKTKIRKTVIYKNIKKFLAIYKLGNILIFNQASALPHSQQDAFFHG